MSRTSSVGLLVPLVPLVLLLLFGCGVAAQSEDTSLERLVDRAEATRFDSIDELHEKVQQGEVSYPQITADALQRIQQLDDQGPRLNAIVETLPASVERARQLGDNNPGLLAGIPFVVKANIDTAGPMHTHAGSLALAERVPPDAADLVVALQNAGGILVGMANLSEWANFRSSRSVSGWSSIGGQTKNPHVLDRNPCGSSSGSAVAVASGMVPLAIGTETHGSIVCPAGLNGIVGVKPTLGLVSADGIIPIAASQDTAGPMTRSVKDAAIALQVLASANAHNRPPGVRRDIDMLAGLETKSLQGLRVGVWRAYAGAKRAPRVTSILDSVVSLLDARGAELVDPAGLYLERALYDASYAVLLHEFRQGMHDFFRGEYPLRQLMAFNDANASKVMPWFGQEIFAESLASNLSDEEYAAALDAGQGEMRRRLDSVFAKFRLDVIIAPTNGPAWRTDVVHGDRFGVSSSGLAAISGRPAVTIPAGEIQHLPIGVSLVGKMWQDDELLAIAYALEQLLPPAPRPQFRPSLEPAS